MRRRYRSGILAVATLALGWLLFLGSDAPETSRSGRLGDAPEAADSAESTGPGSRRAGKKSAEGEGFEVAREREGRRPGHAVDRIRWRNEPDSGDVALHDSSGEMAFSGAEAIFLDPLTVLEGAGTVQFSGEDPHAPRDLIAWRNREGRRSLLARGWSDEEGALHFPQILVPQNGLEVVITDASSAPGAAGGSITRSLPGRLPVAPRARLTEFSDGEYWFRVTPMEGVGTVLLANADGTIFAAYAVNSTPYRADRVFDVGVTSPGSFVLFGHEFSDGRVSDWQVVELDTPDVAAAGY